jgi:tRNA(Ile)-lysidine synthase
MLLAFAELAPALSIEPVVLTVDHGLRVDAREDVEFVAALSAAAGLPFRAVETKVSIEYGVEAGARRARYRAFASVARDDGAELIATAHTVEDQVETLIMRLARGAGTRGARGILRRRGRVVRPMLDVTRAEVRDFLASRGVTPREDPTNRSPRFTRNRVRAVVLPALVEALGEGALSVLSRSAGILADDERLLARLARRRGARVWKGVSGGMEAAVEDLRKLPSALARRVLRDAVRQMGVRLTSRQVDCVCRAWQGPHPIRGDFAGGLKFTCRYGLFRLSRSVPCRVRQERVSLPAEGVFEVARAAGSVRRVDGPGRADPGAIRVDPAMVTLPLELRSRNPGDRFRSRRGHGKKLKAFLIDRKVPREARDGLLLLSDARGRVLWLIGMEEGDAAVEGERAERALEVRVVLKPSEASRVALEEGHRSCVSLAAAGLPSTRGFARRGSR